MIVLWVLVGVAALWALVTVVPHLVATGLGLGVARRGRHAGAVALTFDDGPHPTNTRRICDVLEAHGMRGTFFVLGERVRENPRVLCELVERGHEVQLHGLRHRHLWFTPPGVTRSELRETLRLIDETAGIRPTYFRPPWGMCSLPGLLLARGLKLRTARWSVCPEGFWVRRPAEELAERILKRLRPGDVVCLHDAGGFPDTPERVEACLRLLLPKLEERGLLGLGLSEVLAG